METVCKNCVFAVYNNKTQVGCSTNQLEKLQDNGGVLIEVYDHELEFYVVTNTHCLWNRPKAWAEKQTGDLSDAARKEMTIKYGAVIYANDSLDDLITTLKSLYEGLPPSHITVVRDMNNQYRPSDFVCVLNEYAKCQWRLQDMVPEEKDSALDYAIKNMGVPYYAVFRAGFVVPSDLFSCLDTKINDEGFKFSVIEPNEDGNGLIGSSYIYLYVHQHVIEASEWNRLATTIHQVFPNFPRSTSLSQAV